MKKNTIVLVLLLTLLSCTEQQKQYNKLDTLFTRIEEKRKGMGSVSIFKDGKEVYQFSYGYADIKRNIKSNANTKYRIGSITKTFTATVIMKLVEDGILSLTDTLIDFYPQISNADKITIANMLEHRSGISDFTDVSDYCDWNTQFISKEQLLERIVTGGSNFKPDDQFQYSNSNYVLLTFIVEDMSGKPIEQLFKDLIFEPLDLKRTSFGGIIYPDNNEALSYVKLSQWNVTPETDLSIPLGAGAITSTPTDVNTFFTALFAGKIVNEDSLEQMMNLKERFGYGISFSQIHDLHSYGHAGRIDGFHSITAYFPEKNLAVTILSNGVDYPLNDIFLDVLSLYLNRKHILPETGKRLLYLIVRTPMIMWMVR